MKEIKRYICGHCGAEYEEKDQCNRCEESHKRPAGVMTVNSIQYGRDKYPEWIDVLMSDGTTIRYTAYGVVICRD